MNYGCEYQQKIYKLTVQKVTTASPSLKYTEMCTFKVHSFEVHSKGM